MKKHLLSFTLLALLLLPGSLFAQSEAELNARIDALEARLEKSQARSEKWGKIVEKLPKISGYAQLGYQWSNNDLSDASTSTFSIMSVRLSLAGDISPKFDYKVQVEFAGFKLIDAFVRYKLHPGFSLQAGQFHTNFSIEGPFAPLDMEAITYAPVVEQVCTKVVDSRDIGLAAYGAAGRRDGFNIFEYSLGVFNGEGKNNLDANKSKDIVGRVKINPVKDLTLSGSFSYGEKGADYVHNTRVAGGIWYHSDSFWVRSEYIGLTQDAHTKTTLPDNTVVKDPKKHIDGCYVTTGYWIKKFCPLVRFSYMDSGVSGTYVQQTEFLVGVDYKPVKNLRLQANYSRSHFNAGMGNTNLVALAVTGSF